MKKRHTLPVCLFDSRILALTEEVMVWHFPGDRRLYHLCQPGGEPVSLMTPWPSLLLAVVQQPKVSYELHAVALRRRGRPLASTPLHHAPLLDIDRDGRLAGGDGGISRLDPRDLSQWEARLVDHVYRRTLHERSLKPPELVPGAAVNTYHHTRFWRSLARDEATRFPGPALVPRRQTLEQWLTGLAQP